jgi:hypothetical protein
MRSATGRLVPEIVRSPNSQRITQLPFPGPVVSEPEVAFTACEAAVCSAGRSYELFDQTLPRLNQASSGSGEAFVPDIEGGIHVATRIFCILGSWFRDPVSVTGSSSATSK